MMLSVRKPAVAGSFYPASAKEIRTMAAGWVRPAADGPAPQEDIAVLAHGKGLKNILMMKEAGVHVELTNLLVPGLNDAPEQVAGATSTSIW